MIRLLFRLAFFCVSAWLVGLIAYTSWILYLEPYQGRAEGIVVLTGGDHRVETGVALLAHDRAQHLLISGVNPQVRKTELLSKENRSLADQVDLGFTAQDTLGNADETAQWVRKKQLQSLIVVTSHYHMPRALVHLGAVLPEITLYPYSVRPDAFRQDRWYRNAAPWRLIIREYNKFLLTYPKILLIGGGV